jgi:predicted nucleic acid-binding protein
MANRLRDFTLREPIFADTNIFIYQQAGHPDFGPDCRDFLDKVERGGVQTVTSAVVINEASYIIQIQRAASLMGTTNRGQIQARMAADPVLATECWLAVEQYLTLIEALQRGGLTVIDVELSHYGDARIVGRQSQLFVSDATHAVICQQLGIEHIATNDADFDRVPFLTRWEPRP